MNPLNQLIRRENRERIAERLEEIKQYLTPFQCKVLDLTSEGLSLIEIADELQVEHSNIYDHFRRISRRLARLNVYVDDFKELCEPVEDHVYSPITRNETFLFERLKKDKKRLQKYFDDSFGDDKTRFPN